ncbi:hypothetical protein GGX14DRAFT_542762 [Mycena pura]|uniref:Uncharacterized protein n=1 Tax=Mycena pura TaxID=153505 RepID=A0AAD6VJD2_9AGAR|nr:hypothetical protein GGX14DRAFT_542762 [Mycena pura]
MKHLGDSESESAHADYRHPVRVKETLSTTARMQRGSHDAYAARPARGAYTMSLRSRGSSPRQSPACSRCHALAALQAVLTALMDRVDATFVGAAAARQCARAARRVLGQLCFVSWAGSSNNAPSQRPLNRIMITHLVPRLLGTISPSTERSPLIIYAELLMTAPPLSNTLHVCRTLLDDSNDSHVPVLTASQRSSHIRAALFTVLTRTSAPRASYSSAAVLVGLLVMVPITVVPDNYFASRRKACIVLPGASGMAQLASALRIITAGEILGPPFQPCTDLQVIPGLTTVCALG